MAGAHFDQRVHGISTDEVVASSDKKKSEWKKFMACVGPGLLVSITYVDPGNLESDLQSGAALQYEILWVVLLASIFTLIIQSRAANLGAATGKHLAEHCRKEYPRKISYFLWLLGELAVIGADIPEVIGTAVALNMLFSIPLWGGVLLTGSGTLILLGVERFGIQKLEFIITILVFLVAGCFFGELGHTKLDAAEIFKGMFVPLLGGNGAIGLAISLIGAFLMPHNLFLNSALVVSRNVSNSISEIDRAFALFVAFLVNVAVLCVTASVCFSANISSATADNCANMNIHNASFLLGNVLGKWSSKVFAVALLASGLGSTITGTYAGQYVMQGFLNLKMKPWKRSFITRGVAIIPSLAVAILGGTNGAGQLIITCSIILSIILPFAMIPLLKFTDSKIKMGPHKNSITLTVLAWLTGLIITVINIYYISTTFMSWLLHNNLPKIASVVIGLAVLAAMLVYVVGILYLVIRGDKTITYIAPGGESLGDIESVGN